MSLPISYLTGNPHLEALELEDEMREDARTRYPGLPDDPALEMEMATAFKWDVPPTDAELEEDYTARRCDEAELLAKYPGLRGKSDQELIGLIADGPFTLPGEDPDEVAAVAAILLSEQLGAGTDRRTA